MIVAKIDRVIKKMIWETGTKRLKVVKHRAFNLEMGFSVEMMM